ncbi:MAG: glycosyltransferase family 4 protein [Thermaerobacter sp.]|nr:glycosyltransferase family 4 protein [Thermaerobacter sp.]
MRIVELYGGGTGGGAARHLTDLLPALGARGDDVHYVSLGRDDLAPEGAQRHTVTGLSALSRLLSRLRPDVLHTHGVRANFRGRLLGKMQCLPVVTTVHSFLAQDYRSPLRAGLALQLDGATLQWSDRLIAISESLRDDLVQRGALASSVRVVQSGITPPPPDVQTLREAVPQRPLLCVAARLHPTKGVDVALQALALLPAAHLAVLGEGPERAVLEALAVRLGIAQRVHFLGYRKDFAAIVAGADLFLVPSRAEGFGLAALEAMAQGVPVAASRVGGLPELIGDGGIYAPPEDPAALAEAVLSALGERDALAQRAKKRAGRFSLDAMANQTRAVLREAMEVKR